MKRYFIYFSYKGTNYSGWQIQPNSLTVQEVMQDAFSTILRSKTELVAAGRTDSGVHARQMIAHVDISVKIDSIEGFVSKLNSFLPRDISIYRMVQVDSHMHARFDAVSRKYEYHVVTAKNVFLDEYAMQVNHLLDFDKMNEAAEMLFSYNDFTSFSKLHTDTKTNICRIISAKWLKRGENHWVFEIKADRFLRDMVRAIVGTLLDVGRGKMSIDDFKGVIEAKQRSKAGVSVPGKGLFLVEVKY